jgi:Icc-related predicted phosphoesterase
MNGGNKETMDLASCSMNDYQIVSRGTRVLTPDDTVAWFLESKAFIEAELRRPFDGPTVVVTHHLPSSKSIAPQYKGDPLNPCFASDLDSIFETYQPEAWIHGHTHSSFDYTSGKTRVVCNPRGYAETPNPAFKDSLVIDI